MLKALIPGAAVAAFAFSSFAYEGPMPGDLALSDDMCHEICDVHLNQRDEVVVACHGLCDDVKNCRMNQSFEAKKFNECVQNSNRRYALVVEGHSIRQAAMNADAERAVVTDADNFRTGFEEDNQKGFLDSL